MGGGGIGRDPAGPEGLGAAEEVDGNLGVGVAERGCAGLEALFGALADPSEALLTIAGAEFGEEFEEAAVESFLDSHA